MIKSFDGAYRFLSNFWPAEVRFNRETYPTTEHAYQAAKTLDPEEQTQIREAPTPGKAKRYGRYAKKREDWNHIKIGVMRELLRQKFAIPELRRMLLETGNENIIEGNTWNDKFWGMAMNANGDPVEGENHLGRLIMKIRDEIANQELMEAVASMTVKFEFEFEGDSET